MTIISCGLQQCILVKAARFLNKFENLDFDLYFCRTYNKISVREHRYPWCLEEKARSLQFLFKTMAVCCSAISLSERLCERGRAAGSEEATHTLLERDDHLSPGDSQGLGYQVTKEESSKGQRESRQKWNFISMHKQAFLYIKCMLMSIWHRSDQAIWTTVLYFWNIPVKLA